MTDELAIPETPVAPNLFGTPDPKAAVARISEYADVLADVLRQQKLTSSISGRRHVNVEGWTLLGSMLGVFPVCTWTRPVGEPDANGKHPGWEARVEAVTRSGEVVGAAEAMCMRSENTWKNRDEYAIRSMAQTRAASKALRQPLGFIVVLAGYEATPEEELPGERKTKTVEGPAPKPLAQSSEGPAPSVDGSLGEVEMHSGQDGPQQGRPSDEIQATSLELTRLVEVFGSAPKALKRANELYKVATVADLTGEQVRGLILEKVGT